MERIRMLAGIARRRLFLQEWIAASWVSLAVAAAVLLALVLERRLLGFSSALGVPSGGIAWIAVAALVAAAAAAAAGAVRVRSRVPTLAQAALELDARLGSAERLSTAIALAESGALAEDPFARAALTDAVAFASGRDVAVRAREAFPLRLTGRWWAGPAMLAACVAAWAWVPQREGSTAPSGGQAARTAPRTPGPEERRLDELVKEIERTPELAARLDAELDAARRTLDETGRGPVRSPEDAARESARRMAELEQRLAEVADSRESRASRELQDALAKLDLPSERNAARDLAEALKRGDFDAARKAVDELKKAASGTELPKEERERLAKALEETSRRLDSLAKDPSKLAEALRSAGMDPALANNPAALQQAIAQSKDLNASQKEALQRTAQSMQDAQSRLGQMSQQMDRMASQCRNPGQEGQQSASGSQGKEGQGGQQASAQQGQESQDGMSGMLDQAEADRQMAMAAEGAAAQCQGGMSESEADSALAAGSESSGTGSGEGSGRKQGSGGGHGQATGGERSMRETGFGTKIQKQKGPRQDGDVIARQLVAGQSPVGESRIALEEVAGTIAPGYERGTEDDPVPAHLREVHKRYFGSLRKKFEDRGIAPAKPAPGSAPARGAPGGAGGGADGR